MGLGLSRVIGIISALSFLAFCYIRATLGFILLSLPLLYTSLVFMAVSVASHPIINVPMLLGKKPDGKIPIWSAILFSPYLYFARVVRLIPWLIGEAPFTEVCEGLYVGGWPSSPGKSPPGDPAIIDCTCEFPRNFALSGGQAYFCIPTWDTGAPKPDEIESAVVWGCRKRAQKIPVFVHCAHGRGRSVVVTCALLVALRVAEDWKDAEKLIREKRPFVRLNALHCKALREWSNNRLQT